MTASIISFQPTLKSDLQLPEDWTNQELAELYRVEDALRRAGLNIETERGRSDEGEPWFLFCRPETGDMIVHFAKIDGFFIAASAMSDRVMRGSDFRSLVDQVVATQPLVLPREGQKRDGKPTKLFLHPSVMLTAFVATALLHAEETELLEFDELLPALPKADMATAVNRLQHSSTQTNATSSVRTDAKTNGPADGGVIQQLTGQVMAAVVIALAMLDFTGSDGSEETDATRITGDVLVDADGNVIANLNAQSKEDAVEREAVAPVQLAASDAEHVTQVSHEQNIDDQARNGQEVQDQMVVTALPVAEDQAIADAERLSDVQIDTAADLMQFDSANVITVSYDEAEMSEITADAVSVDADLTLSIDAERLNVSEAVARLDGDTLMLVTSLLDDTPVDIDVVYSIHLEQDVEEYARFLSNLQDAQDDLFVPISAPDLDRPTNVDVPGTPNRTPVVSVDVPVPGYDYRAEYALNRFTQTASDLEMMLIGDEVVFYDKADIGHGGLVVRSWELGDGGMISIIGQQEELDSFII